MVKVFRFHPLCYRSEPLSVYFYLNRQLVSIDLEIEVHEYIPFSVKQKTVMVIIQTWLLMFVNRNPLIKLLLPRYSLYIELSIALIISTHFIQGWLSHNFQKGKIIIMIVIIIVSVILVIIWSIVLVSDWSKLEISFVYSSD